MLTSDKCSFAYNYQNFIFSMEINLERRNEEINGFRDTQCWYKMWSFHEITSSDRGISGLHSQDTLLIPISSHMRACLVIFSMLLGVIWI